VRVFGDLVPSSLVDLEPGASAALAALEEAVAERPEYLALATQVHASRPWADLPAGCSVPHDRLRPRSDAPDASWGCTILHVDMDAFYASVMTATGPTCRTSR
jgi:hypothetical protein